MEANFYGHVFGEVVELSGPLGFLRGLAGGWLTRKRAPLATSEGAFRPQRQPPQSFRGISNGTPVSVEITGWTLLGKLKAATQQSDSGQTDAWRIPRL